MSLILTGLAFTYTLNFKKLFSIKLYLSRALQFRGVLFHDPNKKL